MTDHFTGPDDAARDVPDGTGEADAGGFGEEGMMTGYHGTTRAALARALATGGLRNPFLTDSYERAAYYAKEAAEEAASGAAEETAGEPVVVTVRAPLAWLRYDAAAMEEPVLADEDERDRAWQRAAAEHPEWVRGQMVIVDERAWCISWRAVGSVRVVGTIATDQVSDPVDE